MKKLLIIAAAILAMTACRQNPLLSEWDTPYGIPPFESIKISDYKPAIKAGIAQQEKQIAEIKACAEAPSFENTIAALDRSGEILARVSGVLYNVAETENCPEIEKLIDEITPVVSEHSDNIYMDKALFERVAAVWNADQSGLTREQQMLLKKTYRAFERNGIALPEEAQAELRKINSESSVKINKIGNNILAESNAFKAEFGISVSAYPTAMSETADRSLR